MAPSFGKIVPKKPVVKLEKKVKPIHWNRIIVPPKDAPKKIEMLWDDLKEVNINQKEIEELFEVKVKIILKKGIRSAFNSRSNHSIKYKEKILQ